MVYESRPQHAGLSSRFILLTIKTSSCDYSKSVSVSYWVRVPPETRVRVSLLGSNIYGGSSGISATTQGSQTHLEVRLSVLSQRCVCVLSGNQVRSRFRFCGRSGRPHSRKESGVDKDRRVQVSTVRAPWETSQEDTGEDQGRLVDPFW